MLVSIPEFNFHFLITVDTIPKSLSSVDDINNPTILLLRFLENLLPVSYPLVHLKLVSSLFLDTTPSTEYLIVKPILLLFIYI